MLLKTTKVTGIQSLCASLPVKNAAMFSVMYTEQVSIYISGQYNYIYNNYIFKKQIATLLSKKIHFRCHISIAPRGEAGVNSS